MLMKAEVDGVRLVMGFEAQKPGPLSAAFTVASESGPVRFPSTQSMLHLARKYLGSAISVDCAFNDANECLTLFIRPGTDKDQRAAFLGALAAKTKLIPG